MSALPVFSGSAIPSWTENSEVVISQGDPYLTHTEVHISFQDINSVPFSVTFRKQRAAGDISALLPADVPLRLTLERMDDE